MKIVHYDGTNGNVLGFYDTVVHGDNIPHEHCVKISDDIWKTFIDNQNGYVVDLKNQYGEEVITQFDDVFVAPIFDTDVLLEEMKNAHISVLSKKCESTVEAGFKSSATGKEHFYRFNKNEDQLNFNQQATILQLMPEVKTVYWKTEDAGVIPHTREQFIQVLIDVANFKQATIQKYWTLKAQVIAAKTAEEVSSIVW